MIDNTKTCRNCSIEKSLTDFHFDKIRMYHTLDCKSCYNEKTKKRRGSKFSKIKWNDSTFKNLTEKLCPDCNEVKSLGDWMKSSRNIDGLGSRCKSCHAERNKKYYKPYSDFSEAEKKKQRQRKREYRSNNKELYNKKDLERYHANPQRKIAVNFRTRLSYILKKYNSEKTESSIKYLGCSLGELQFHLESNFKEGMNWSNHGSVWHIDHIIPCASFDLTKKSEQLKCFNYNNLQPLFATTDIAIQYGHMNEIGNLNKQDKLI